MNHMRSLKVFVVKFNPRDGAVEEIPATCIRCKNGTVRVATDGTEFVGRKEDTFGYVSWYGDRYYGIDRTKRGACKALLDELEFHRAEAAAEEKKFADGISAVLAFRDGGK